MLRLLFFFPAVVWAAPPTVAEIDGLAAARISDLSVFDPGLAAADPAVQVAAIHALGRLQTPAALPRLERALGAAHADARAAAAFAWGQLETAPAGPLVARFGTEEAPAVRARLIEALGKLKATDRPLLLEVAHADADTGVRATARVALGLIARREEGAAPGLAAHLAEWLGEPEARLRWGAAFALRRAEKLVEPAVLEVTLKCAADADAEVRALCVRSLGRFTSKVTTDARVGPALLTAARDPDWRVAVEAWRAAEKAGRLAALDDALGAIPEAVAADRTQLSGARLHVWTTALDVTLAAPPSPRARAVAEALFAPPPKHESAWLGRAHLRCRAAAILDRAGGDRLSACDPGAPAGLVAALTGPLLTHLEPPARAAAIAQRYPKATSAGMRIALLDLASGLKGQAAVAPIVEAGVNDPDVAAFSQAAMTAGALEMTALAPIIRGRVATLHAAQEHEAVIAALDALGALKDAGAMTLLRELSTDPNAAVAEAAAKARTALGEDAEAAPTPRAPKPVPRPGARAATVRTSKGDFTITLYADAPLTVRNFVTLAERGYYDGLIFHRVVGDFVVQGGDPRGDGWGGPGYSIPCEINPRPYARGAVGMALAGKDTGGSQWFVTHSPQPHLDGRYTVFGRTEGFAVVDSLAVGDRILGVTIHRPEAKPAAP